MNTPNLPKRFDFKKADPAYLERLRRNDQQIAVISANLRTRHPNGPDDLRRQREGKLKDEKK